jgi:hypothetical protein
MMVFFIGLSGEAHCACLRTETPEDLFGGHLQRICWRRQAGHRARFAAADRRRTLM